MLRTCVSAFLFSTLASTALGSVFYGVTDNTLVRIDTAAQSVSTVGTLKVGATNLSLMADCDYDGSGTLIALRQGSQDFTPLNQVFSVNVTTAAALQQVNFGNTKQLNGIAWSQSLNKFMTVSQSDGILASLDVPSGVVTPLYAVKHGLGGPNKIEALAFAPNGDLYGIWDGGPPLSGIIDHKLVRFNLTTGTATAIGSIGTSAERFFSLRFDEAGAAYTVNAFSGTVYTVNLATGAGSAVFTSTALLGTTGLALQVPAPASIAGVFCLAGIASFRRRR